MTDREKICKGLECCDEWGLTDKECIERKCPYFEDHDFGDIKCIDRLHKDALALLREQEPRVMTREEVIATPEGVVVWMEEEAESGTYIQPIVSTGNGCLGNFYIGVGAYGVEMRERRFWTSRPTPEQMANTPWEGEAE